MIADAQVAQTAQQAASAGFLSSDAITILLAILGATIAFAALVMRTTAKLDADRRETQRRFDEHQRETRHLFDTVMERLARVEGKLDLLLQGLQIRIGPKNTKPE